MRTIATILVLLLGAATVVTLAYKPEEKRVILLENERVRVKEVWIAPGIDYAPHTHDYAHVGVIIKKGTLQFTENGKAETVEFKEGQAGWRGPGVTHSIRNVGKNTVHVVEVELKN
ncbi:MAG: cupin domain-containing protein [Acidobacteriota bacterium]